jgi:pimeloyl-ACP methyl ester carboxylesterase
VKLQLKSGSIGYLDEGSGPAVLLIHAFPLNKAMWAPQMDPLSRRFRVIAPDIRGFGESQPASPWTMEDMAGDLHELLDKLGIDQCTIAGVSIGGYIALAFWSKYPGRVRQLVLSNSRARGDNDSEKAARNDMIAAIRQNGAAILPERMLTRLLQPNPLPDVVRTVRGMIEQANASAAEYAVTAMRDRSDFTSVLHGIKCPAMVITGENDAIIRAEDAKAVADAIPGARFVKIPDSGHLSNLENPEAFNAAILNFTPFDSK